MESRKASRILGVLSLLVGLVAILIIQNNQPYPCGYDQKYPFLFWLTGTWMTSSLLNKARMVTCPSKITWFGVVVFVLFLVLIVTVALINPAIEPLRLTWKDHFFGLVIVFGWPIVDITDAFFNLK